MYKLKAKTPMRQHEKETVKEPKTKGEPVLKYDTPDCV